MDDIGGVWRTVGGRRIFIKDGQDLSLAMRESGKFPNKDSRNKENYKILTDTEINELQKSSDECYNKLTSDEKEALQYYCEDGYSEVNDYLNDKFEGYESTQDFVKQIDNIVSKYELKEDVVTFRKTGKQFYDNYKVGDVFQEKMFYSTSLKKNIADNVSEYHSDPITAEIRVPKGTKSIYIGDNNKYEFEAELLLNRGLSYKVIEKSGDNLILEVVDEKRK